MNADVTIQNENSIFIFNLETDAAREWVVENVHLDTAQWWGQDGLVVAQQCAAHLAEGMREAGLELE